MNYAEDTDEPRVIKALSHPLRIQILGMLDGSVRSPKEIAAELGEPLGNVSYHVRTLAELGLIELVRKVPRRGAIEHFYGASELRLIPGRAVMRVDEAGRAALAAEWSRFLGRAEKIAKQNRGEAFDVSLLFMHFDVP